MFNLHQENGKACPPHPGFFNGMCFVCGKSKSEIEEQDKHVNVGYLQTGLHLSQNEIKKTQKRKYDNLVQRKKLLFVLDLDHTLLNSTTFKDVPQ